MTFAIKAEVTDPSAKSFVFSAQKTMYGGKRIAKGNIIFVFASENNRGRGLIASGVVTLAKAIAKKRGIARQTPRVSVTIRRTALAKRRLGDANSSVSVTGTTVDRRASSISNSIARLPIRLLASQMKPQNSFAGSFEAVSDTTRQLGLVMHNPALPERAR